MAKDISFDANYDLVWPIEFKNDIDELTQALTSILVTPKGRFTNPDVGLNFDFLTGGFDEDMAKTMIADDLMQDQRVTHVDFVKCSTEQDKTTVDINFQVQTTLGEINLKKGVRVNAAN